MTSYLSSLLTTTTSRVASIRQNLLPTEDDGATEDDTHICRVLRAYYTEKNRQFPAWLPPDPKAPPPVVVQPVYANPSVGAGYGGAGMQPQASGLSSLWDKSGGQAGPGAGQGGSLRQGRASPFTRQPLAAQNLGAEQAVQARPLPSQREGSYQSQSPFGRDSPAPSAGTASNRLKDRFRAGGARSASPANSTSSTRQNSYDSGPSKASYDSKYEDSFMPRESASKPFVAPTSPWASNEAEFSGGSRARPGGLPSGPAAGRRGPGLPSGPRGMR